jgi:hypothetical protein
LETHSTGTGNLKPKPDPLLLHAGAGRMTMTSRDNEDWVIVSPCFACAS